MTLSSKNDKIVQMLPGIQTIHSEPIHLMSPFVDVVQKFADLSGTVALMSGGTSDCARHHILGIDPWMIFSSKKDALSITHAGDTKTVTGDPFAMLGQLIRHFEIDLPKEAAPIRAGLLGYLAYDLKDHT
jgi:para-aminobenzoate synthetase component 1